MGGRQEVVIPCTVHDYRPAIDSRCVVGVCSPNNCLYPHCVKGD